MIGLEIQDARVVAIAVDENGAVRSRASAAGADLAAAAAGALDELGAARHAAVGVAVPGEAPSSLPAVLEAVASRASLFARRTVPSGTAGAVAEAWVGAARGVRNVAFFAAADHTIGGLIRDGAPLHGSHGRAASVAWLALNPVEREDYRRMGCVESEVAAAGTVRRLIWRIKAGDRSRVQDLVGADLSAITLDHVLDGARQGDGVCISVVRDTAKYLGMAAANLVAIADPEMLVLGGIMASAPDLLMELVRSEVARRLPRGLMDGLAIAPAALGDDAAAIGAARLAATAAP